MKICFNQATAMKNSTLALDLEWCEKTGYDFIEIRLDKLREYLQGHTVADLAAFFAASHLKPYSFNALEFISFRDEAGYKEITDGLKFCCETGAAIGCSKTVVVPTFDVGPYSKAEIKAETVRVLHELSDIAAPYGMRLAFEFVGYPNCSVNTLEQAYGIVAAADRDNVGIVLDCFHFHAMNSRWEALEAIDPAKLFIFHLDDSEDLPVGALRDDKRLWPGEGAVDLARIFGILKAKGYAEMTSIELFRPAYWDMPVPECIQVAYDKTKETIAKYV
ncbi:MAG: sugar phosphate isomerase/epimerase [Firmicutes bacterium]|nr:sugar phosphate isomerase/epimerase [Bacillota bacterium]